MTLPKFNINIYIVKWFDWLKYLFLIYIAIIIWLILNVWQVPTELNGLLFLPPCPLCNVIKDNSFCCWQTNALERLSQVTVGHTIRTVPRIKLHLNVTYQEQAFTFIRTIFIFCPKCVTWLSLSKKWVVDGEIFCSGRAKAKLWLSVKITWWKETLFCVYCVNWSCCYDDYGR